jgi:enoyl-CoA hydratase/carnithine racemase
VVAPEELDDRAMGLAAELARGAVVAQGLAKRAIDRGLQGSLSAGIDLEQELFAEAFATEDARLGVASFLEAGPGKAQFVGR